MEVSGVSVQVSAFLFPETSYETTPKWHGFLMIRLAAFLASGGARMKLRLAGTVKRLNVELAKGEQALVRLRRIERPTSNVQY